jgi:hypothetical protein
MEIEMLNRYKLIQVAITFAVVTVAAPGFADDSSWLDEHRPPRTVLVGTTDLLKMVNERPVTNWQYFEELDQPTARRVNLALKYLPPPASAMDPVQCHSTSSGGAWFVSCYHNGCLVTVKGSDEGDFGTAITCGLD